MADGAPLCGGHEVLSDDTAAIIEWVMIIAVLVGIGIGIGKLFEKLDDILAVLDKVASFLSPIFDFLMHGLPPVAAATGWVGLILLASVISAGATLLVIIRFFLNRCTAPVGRQTCSAGVVETVIPEFDSLLDEIFPFSAMHPRADVVIKSKYWPLTVEGFPPMVRCAPCGNCPPEVTGKVPRGVCSPMLACFFHSKRVCAAGVGSIIGGAIGALAGMVVGTIAGEVVLVACGVLLLLCLLLAIFVAIAIAATTTLLGAFVGGQIGKASVSEEEEPSSPGVSEGDYITTAGNLISSGFVDGGNAYWFVGWILTAEGSVEENPDSTKPEFLLHGRSMGRPPFCFTDPDANIPDSDGCPA